MRKLITGCCLLLAVFTTTAQTPDIDSLKLAIARTASPLGCIETIFLLEEQRQSLPPDTVLSYLEQAEGLMKKVSPTPLMNNEMRFYQAGYYLKLGTTDSVISIINSFAYRLAKDSAERKLQMKCFFMKGNALIRAGRYKESLSQFYGVLQMASTKEDNFYQVMSRNSIGWAYMDMEQYATAVNGCVRPLLLLPTAQYYRNIH